MSDQQNKTIVAGTAQAVTQKLTLKKESPANLKPGDLIMPPAREVSLWMRKHVNNLGYDDNALLLTITSIEPNYKIDKRGNWTRISAQYGEAFKSGGIRFLVLPTTQVLKSELSK